MNMTKMILGALFMSAFLTPLALSDGETQQLVLHCPSSSAQQFCTTGLVGATTRGPDPTLLVQAAVSALTAKLIQDANVACGPCTVGAICPRSLSGMTSTIQILGPIPLPSGNWGASASYNGCYHVTCGECQ